jgi:hypothetical protein
MAVSLAGLMRSHHGGYLRSQSMLIPVPGTLLFAPPVLEHPNEQGGFVPEVPARIVDG